MLWHRDDQTRRGRSIIFLIVYREKSGKSQTGFAGVRPARTVNHKLRDVDVVSQGNLRNPTEERQARWDIRGYGTSVGDRRGFLAESFILSPGYFEILCSHDWNASSADCAALLMKRVSE